MQIVNLMTPNPVTVGPHNTLADAKRAMDAGGFRRVPVVENGRIVGILTERDIRSHAGYLDSTRVDAVMRSPVVTTSPYNTVEEAASMMLKLKIGGMPVVSSGELVGVVTTSDLLKAFLAEGASVYAPAREPAKPKRLSR
jgi:acetoin utilization protein AcuB